ncbi:hypothetical protein JK636_23030 [Clostridium sp. YIM B02515]|uniref:DUF4282 domain-containing protein n=1 Tax=Clostridium rhizosphaerae TaxID=2803861 RepID=A0ABS1TGS0_9CLOT|nr:hypothetical protein [Clostridium rhizosphaerae]MBL4938582.1 hypothetical protein [Clostridium rhizosphaerae]
MHSYYTELDIEECKKSINEIVKENGFPISGIRGKVDFEKDKFNLLRTDSNYRNSFSRIFYGEFMKKENGTIIQGSFSMSAFVKVFITIWFSGVISIGGLIFLVSFSDVFLGTSFSEGSPVLGMIIPFILLIFGILIVKLGIRLSKNAEEYILELIKRTLNAKEIETKI